MKTSTDNKSFPRVAAVVLLYNGRAWIEQCLKSLADTDYPGLAIIVVDNGSRDDGARYVAQNFPDVFLIRNKSNLGSARGNNIGIRQALRMGADYVALFNQDIKVEPQWLMRLLQVAERDETVGILSPVQYDYIGAEVDKVFKCILQTTTYFDDLRANRVWDFYPVDFVIGASILIRREVFRKVGLFDPLYFIYSDDNDFCRRALYYGFKVGCAPAAQVFHNHSLVRIRGVVKDAAGKTNGKNTRRLMYLFKRNYIIYLLKDPDHPFWWNLKHVYFWTDWARLFREVDGPLCAQAQALIFTLALLPVIYWKYLSEKSRPCYLEAPLSANVT